MEIVVLLLSLARCGAEFEPVPGESYACVEPPGHDVGEDSFPCSDGRTITWWSLS